MAKIAAGQIEFLPHSIETEQALLGALLVDPDALMTALEVDLHPRDFFRESHGWVYQVMLDIAGEFRTPDYVTISDALAHRQNGSGSQLDALGGPAAIAAFMSACASSVYAENYAEQVKRYAQQRCMIAAAGDVAALAHEHEGPIEGLYDEASRVFFDAVNTTDAASHLFGNDGLLDHYRDEQARRMTLLKENPDAILSTGLPDLDRILGPILPAYLHVIVARTSVGKTMYMEQMAEYNASKGHRVAFYHLELTHQNMIHRGVLRRLAFEAKVTFRQLYRGCCGPEVERALDAINKWVDNLVYVHCPGWTAERLCADILRLHAKGQCDMAVIDYLQKIGLPKDRRGFNAALLYGLVAERLKVTAEQLEIPIVLGSQVSRSFKTRGDRRPHMEDIRNSGEIEEKATQIVVLHRPGEREMNSPDQTYGESEDLEAWVEKNSNGPIGKANLVHRMGRYLLYCEAANGDDGSGETESIPW